MVAAVARACRIDADAATAIAEKIIQTGDWSWIDYVLDRLDLGTVHGNAVNFDAIHQVRVPRSIFESQPSQHAIHRIIML